MPELEIILFYSFATLAALGALAILVSRNIVRTAIWLLSTLAAAAGLYFLMGATFIGAIQLIVYTGGTLVLIIFGVMLTSKNPRISYFPKRIEVVAGLAVCVVLAGSLIWICLETPWHQSEFIKYPAQIAQLPPEDKARLTDVNADGTANLGRQLLTTYLVPFEVLSVLLLAVLIGSSYLARPRVPAPARIARAGAGSAPAPAASTPATPPDAVRAPGTSTGGAAPKTPFQGGAS